MTFILFSAVLALNSDINPETEKHILQSESSNEISWTKTNTVQSHLNVESTNQNSLKQNIVVVARGGGERDCGVRREDG